VTLAGRLPRHRPGVEELVAAATAGVGRPGAARAVARLISLVEDDAPQLREVARLLAPRVRGVRTLGLTGAPGVGKSTSTAALVAAFRAAGRSVAVLAVDPSSPFSGGALLGDRVRMQDHATDAGVFIRSMATRGHLGGLAEAVPQALRVLDVAGFDVVLVETVGVGQSEVEVAALADTTLVLLAPGMGDGIQAAKAGLLEVADVFVVNKADREGADATAREIRHMISMGQHPAGSWRQPVVKTVASRGEGLDEVLEAVDKHAAWLDETGRLAERRSERVVREIEAIAVAQLRGRLGTLRGGAELAGLAQAVLRGETDPFRAADALLADL